MNKTKIKDLLLEGLKEKEICGKLKISIKMYKHNIQFIKQNLLYIYVFKIFLVVL